MLSNMRLSQTRYTLDTPRSNKYFRYHMEVLIRDSTATVREMPTCFRKGLDNLMPEIKALRRENAETV